MASGLTLFFVLAALAATLVPVIVVVTTTNPNGVSQMATMSQTQNDTVARIDTLEASLNTTLGQLMTVLNTLSNVQNENVALTQENANLRNAIGVLENQTVIQEAKNMDLMNALSAVENQNSMITVSNQALTSSVQMLNMTVMAQDVNMTLAPVVLDVETLKAVNATMRRTNTGVGLTGGPFTQDGTIALDAVTPDPSGTYGDATNAASVTVDQYGRVTSVSEVPIAAANAVGVHIINPASNVQSGQLRRFWFQTSQWQNPAGSYNTNTNGGYTAPFTGTYYWSIRITWNVNTAGMTLLTHVNNVLRESIPPQAGTRDWTGVVALNQGDFFQFKWTDISNSVNGGNQYRLFILKL